MGMISLAMSKGKMKRRKRMAEQDNQEQDGRADFDFFMGSWKAHNRNLPERLKGSTAWEAFGSTTVARKILGGLGNFEEFTIDFPAGPRAGITLRVFDQESQQWSIYPADTKYGFQSQPMIGAFKEGRGEFYSHEPWAGKHIWCRVIWSEITATSCHWEQAFSADGGRTWETNWITDFERIG